jgi:hypothetical protein
MRAVLYRSVLLISMFPFHGFADTQIDSLPYTCSTPNERYYLSSDLTLDTGTAITISASDVVIDGRNYTLNFAQTGPGVGVDINNQSRVEIKDLTFSTTYTTQDGNYVRAIYTGSSGARSPDIHDCSIYVIGRQVNESYARERGVDGACIASGTIQNNTFDVSGVDRSYALNISGPWTVSGNLFTIHDHTVTSSYPIIVNLGGDTAITVEKNTFNVQSSCTNIYIIGGWNTSNHEILSNTINYAGVHGRIITPDNLSADWIIRNNDINITGAGSGTIYGIRYRNANNAANGGCAGGHIIEYNDIDCSTYQGSGGCLPISVGGYSGDEWSALDCPGVAIRYNKFKALSGAFNVYGSDPVGQVNVEDNDIYCNELESTSTSGFPITIRTQLLDDIQFSHNSIITNHSDGFEVSASDDHTGNVTICESGTIDLSGGGAVSTSSSPCQDGHSGCYSDAGLLPATANHAPVAANDTAVTAYDTPVTINVIANDSDVDGDILTIESYNALSANDGTVAQQETNNLIYTPASGFSGTDTFTYVITDGRDVSGTATVTITVQAQDGSDSGKSETGGSGCFVSIVW